MRDALELASHGAEPLVYRSLLEAGDDELAVMRPRIVADLAAQERLALDDENARELAHRAERLTRMWAESRAMRAADREAGALRLVESTGLSADSGAGKFLVAGFDADVAALRARFEPVISQVRATREALLAEAAQHAQQRAELEWQRQLACRAYVLACDCAGVSKERSVMLGFGTGRVEVRKTPLDAAHVAALAAALPHLRGDQAMVVSESPVPAGAPSGTAASPSPSSPCGTAGEAQSLASLVSSSFSLPNSALTELVLHRQKLGAAAAARLLGALGRSPCAQTLRSLSLTQSAVGSGVTVDVKALSDCLRRLPALLPALRALDLSHNGLGAGPASALAATLRSGACGLERLSVAYCSFDQSQQRRALLEAAGCSGALRFADFSFTGLADEDCAAVADLIRGSSVLRELNVSGSGKVTDAGCATVAAAVLAAAAVADSALEELHVRDCGYTAVGCGLLLRALRANERLRELHFDHAKLLYNPTAAAGSIDQLLSFGMPKDVEVGVTVTALASWPSLAATHLAWRCSPRAAQRGPEPSVPVLAPGPPGPRGPPGLPAPEFRGSPLTMDDCAVGFRCLAQIFEKSDSPWFNVEVLQVLPNVAADGEEPDKVRVLLPDFQRDLASAEDDFAHYDPVRDWGDAAFPIEDPYPLIGVDRLRAHPRDVAVLALHLTTGSVGAGAGAGAGAGLGLGPGHGCGGGGLRAVQFPKGLLPTWMCAVGRTGFLKTATISDASRQRGAVFSYAQPAAGADAVWLDCPNMARDAPAQPPVRVRWPTAALAPRPQFHKAFEPRKARNAAAGTKSVYFAFCPTSASVTGTLRAILRQLDDHGTN